MNTETIITIIGTILGSSAFTMLLQHLLGKRKAKVDADSVTIDNILKWATSLMGRISDLEKKIEARDENIQELYKKFSEEACGQDGNTK